MSILLENSVEALNEIFTSIYQKDKDRLDLGDYFGRWLFAERLAARGVRKEMGFEAYEGNIHVLKLFHLHGLANFMDYFSNDIKEPLITASKNADKIVFQKLNFDEDSKLISLMASYNAQDYLLLHSYAVPERNRMHVQLDFGAGHGRLATLGFNTPYSKDRLSCYIAVDAIPSTYFAQLNYLTCLGLHIWEYFEHADDEINQSTLARVMQEYDVVHLPTWRFDLLPDNSIDMVTCVQVLKELPGPLLLDIFPWFARVLKKTGGVYIRDHMQFHNPNHMPIDIMLQTNGFMLEFAPQIIDRQELHGMPRIWRKVDAMHFISTHNS